MLQKEKCSFRQRPSTEKAVKQEGPGVLLLFTKYSTRDFTVLFVESRDFLLDPPRYVGGSVFTPDLFRINSTQEFHSRPIHKRDVL